jgi:hypothetical protein
VVSAPGRSDEDLVDRDVRRLADQVEHGAGDVIGVQGTACSCTSAAAQACSSVSFAGAYGRGRAVDLASRLQEDRPRVTLDTTERLFLVSADDSLGVVETQLEPVEEGQRLRFRYTRLRLLVEAQGRTFLLPDRWNIDAGYTLVVSVGDDVRFLVYR